MNALLRVMDHKNLFNKPNLSLDNDVYEMAFSENDQQIRLCLYNLLQLWSIVFEKGYMHFS